jgi:cation:H+ antiporter
MKFFITAFFLLAETDMQAASPWVLLWAAPGILVASLMIAWGAEATQFFLAQGIALAVLALLQTLPEFAMEAVFAWHRQVQFLFASLTGALLLLTGLGWPLIYVSAATAYHRERKRPMRLIRLEEDQSVQIFALLLGIAYEAIVWGKGSLTIYDGIVLIAIYASYLWIMRRLPPEEAESIEETGGIPRAIVMASKPMRVAAILGLFLVGGTVVFLVADPFLGSLLGLSTMIGISQFRFVSWVAPLVSEAPEGISAFYWARDPARASIALMNLVSSNINQWTLLAGLLPVVLSLSARHIASIPLDPLQSRDLLLALSQSLLGALFLIDMELVWWEAAGLFVLFLVQLGFAELKVTVTWIDFIWCGVEVVRLITGNRKAVALRYFRDILTAGSR